MISRFVREQRPYTQEKLCEILKCSQEQLVHIIRKLKDFGVLKVVRTQVTEKDLDELLFDDIVVSDANVDTTGGQYCYVFTFVGVIAIANRVIKSYPKYIVSTENPVYEMRQVMKVLEKSKSKEQIVKIFNESSDSNSIHLLAIMIFLLKDYFENGIYTNTKDIIECNGQGEILWNRTINETFPLITNNRPYYMELKTHKRVNDDFDYFKRLHQCILTTVSKELEEGDLLTIFELPEVELTEEILDDFGDREYILYRIEKELSTQFNTQKQLALKTIYAYIESKSSLHDIESFSLFGTNSFNLVWEAVCADIMDNKLKQPLGSLSLPCILQENYNPKDRLIDIIEKPFWTATDKNAKDTLIPDLVSIVRKKEQWEFIIFDAKYYTPKLEYNVTPVGQPGIESVTKQYLYQLAYKDFILDHGFSSVKNCFLLPTEKDDIENKGDVKLGMFSSLELENIKVRMIPARMAYELYLSGSHMKIEELKLDEPYEKPVRE